MASGRVAEIPRAASSEPEWIENSREVEGVGGQEFQPLPEQGCNSSHIP